MGVEPAKTSPGIASNRGRSILARLRGPAGVYAGGFAIALAVAALQISDAIGTWDRGHRDAERTVANLSRLAEQEVARTLRSVDLSLKTVAELVEFSPARRLDDPAIGAAMKERLKDLPFVRTMVVFDADGRTIQNTGGISAASTVSATDRDYFIAHRDSRDVGFYLGRPTVGRVSKQLTVPMSRRIGGADGSFNGAAVAFVDPRAMAEIYANIEIGPGGAIALIRADGTVLARVPYREDLLGRDISGTVLFRVHLPGSPAGVRMGIEGVDGITRLFGYRLLQEFPVVAFVGIDSKEISRRILPGIAADIGSAVGFAAAIGLATVLLARAMRRQRRLLDQVSVSEGRFRTYAEAVSDWYWETGPDHRFTQISEPSIDPGRRLAHVVGKLRWEIAADTEEDPEKWRKHREALERHTPFRDFEYRSEVAPGKFAVYSVSGKPVLDADGRFLGYRGASRDLTAQRVAERAARDASALLADAIESLPDGFALFDAEDRFAMCNTQYRGFIPETVKLEPGRTFVDLIQEVASNLVYPNELGSSPVEWLKERMRRHRNPGTPMEWQTKDGRWLRVVEGRTGKGGTVVLNIDITAQKLAEQKAVETRQRLVDAIDSLPDAFGLFDKDDRLVAFNRAFRQPADSPQALGATTFRDVVSAVAPRVALPDALGTTPEAWVAERIRRHRDSNYSIDVRYKDGRWGHVIESRTREGGTALQRIDITELKRRQEVAERLAAQQRTVAALSQLALKTSDPTELCQRVVESIRTTLSVELVSALEMEPDGKNLTVRADVGWKPGSVGGIEIPTGTGSLAGLALTANKPLVVEDLDRETRFTPHAILIEHKVRSGLAVVIPGYPRPFGALGAYSTELKTFDQDQIDFMQAVAYVLSSSIELRKTERMLVQAQRLESLGQLTGGIAHDFNNLLTVIIGQSSLLRDDLKDAPPHRDMAETIHSAGMRAAELTSRLLAFARGQTLQASSIDPNGLIDEIAPLLRRSIGEHIQLHTVFGDVVPECRADRSQLVTAIINLAVNARDAMPQGGLLTIETSRTRLEDDYAAMHPGVTPGDYVQISVSDTGHGMTPEVLARAYEPFFTTKPVGKGTGLGLSMVYGFVKQSGGHISVYSEVGHGTTVRLYLPVDGGDADAHRTTVGDALARQAVAGDGDGATILLVEDDDLVRAFAAEQLRRLGYSVIEAHSGLEALERLGQSPRIDLLFTDIVMPGGMNGAQLAEAARRLRPDLRVLFTSGHPVVAMNHLPPDALSGGDLLNKPYTTAELAQRIKAALSRA